MTVKAKRYRIRLQSTIPLTNIKENTMRYLLIVLVALLALSACKKEPTPGQKLDKALDAIQGK